MSKDPSTVPAIRWMRIGLVGMSATGLAAFFAFRVTDPFWAFACGLPLAGLIRFEYLLWRDRREHPAREVHGEKWDTCGRCGMFQDNCWCHKELRQSDTPAGPPVEVGTFTEAEWDTARAKALSELGCSYPELAQMAADRDYPTFEHRKLWLAMGGLTGYHDWADKRGAA